jgi:signal transduction histidine kinase
MKSWFADTLGKRLFLLMWGALVLSHLLAFAAVSWAYLPDLGPGSLPTFPSLPPTPGVPDARGPMPPDRPALDAQAPSPQSQPDARGEPAPPRGGLPLDALLLDYGVRLLVIALAAWWGSRWVSRPVRQLVAASDTLAAQLDARKEPLQLPEHEGTVEVREAAEVFNRMARQIHRQFRERKLMVAAISHDLRTPLTRLRMRLETMGLPAESMARSVEDLHEMNELIGSALDLFRMPDAVEPAQHTHLTALLQSICDDLAEQGHAVSFEGPELVASIQPRGLRRVLDNLIGNALRYGSRAAVRLEKQAGAIHISIDDDGPGIPAEMLEAVFQPFFRLEGSRHRDTGGQGLGLYIARDLIERQGGRLVLLNRPGGGLRAQIILKTQA